MKKEKTSEEKPVFLPLLDGKWDEYTEDEYEERLAEKLTYNGMYQGLRRMGLRLFSAKQISLLSDFDLADEIQKYYAVVARGDEEISPVKRDLLEEYRKLVCVISR